MPVIRVGIQGDIGHEHQFGHGRFHLAQGAEKQIIPRKGMRSARIFAGPVDDRKNGRRGNTQIESLAAFTDQILHASPLHPGHRRDGLVSIPAVDKKRVNQIGHIESRFTGHPPQAFAGPVAPQTGG